MRHNPSILNFLLLLLLVSLSALFSIEAVNIYPLDSDYHRFEDIMPSIRELSATNQHLVSAFIIGQSSNHKYPIYAFRITNKYYTGDNSKAAILFHGQHHAEEVIGIEIVFSLAKQILEQYGKDTFTTYLVDNYELWFIPTANPEGFAIVGSGQYRLKRKNETDTNFNGIREIRLDGVDLNRNYPIHWENDDMTDVESPYFKGYEPACQEETQTMMRFYEEIKFQLAFFYHSSATGAYSERIFFPWRWDSETSPDYNEMLFLAKTLASKLPRTYQEGNYIVHQFGTSKRGLARDYIYSQHGTPAMLIEVGGNSPYGEGVINPPNNILNLIVKNHINAMMSLLQEFDLHLTTAKVVDSSNTPVKNIEVYIEDKISPYKNNVYTDSHGNFHYYLLPRRDDYNFVIGDNKFSVTKSKDKKDNFVFRLNNTPPIEPQIEKLNNGKAIIISEPAFQYFPALQIRNSSALSAFVSLSTTQEVAYRKRIPINNQAIMIPWLPADVLKIGTLTISLQDHHPALSKFAIRNKIVFLNNDTESLSYCEEYSSVAPYYLQQDCIIGIDYSTQTSGETGYLIKEIKVITDEKSLYWEKIADKLELSIYSGAELLFTTVKYSKSEINSFTSINFSIPMLSYPNNLFIRLTNKDFRPLPILRDTNNSTSSNNSYEYFTDWLLLKGNDLAVEVILARE